MAIFRTGPIVASISGPIGGLIFSTGRSTATVRTRPKHRASTTPAALAARARVTTQMIQWGEQSPETKSAWANAALQFSFVDPLGQQRNLSPFQLFVKMRAFQTTFASKPQVPDGSKTTAPYRIQLISDDPLDGIHLRVDYSALENANLLIYGRRSFHQYPARPRKAFKFLLAAAAQPVDVDLNSVWLENLGTLTNDEYVEVEALTIADRKFPSFRLRAGTIVDL